MNTTTSVTSLTPRSEEEMKRETCLSLAADLIERGLQSRLEDMHMFLIQIADTELIPKGDLLRGLLEDLCAEGERLSSAAHDIFPGSWFGGACKLRRATCHNLVKEVDLFRQEKFWTKRDRKSLLQAEDLIAAMFKFYARAEWLILNIDADQPDYRIERRTRAPLRPINPYEDIVPS